MGICIENYENRCADIEREAGGMSTRTGRKPLCGQERDGNGNVAPPPGKREGYGGAAGYSARVKRLDVAAAPSKVSVVFAPATRALSPMR